MNDLQRNKQFLKNIFQETIHIVNIGHYQSPNGDIISLGEDREMRENTRFYSHEFTVNDIPVFRSATEITVKNEDSIYAGIELKREGYNPVVLNFASRRNAGGGVINGARAHHAIRRTVRCHQKLATVSDGSRFWWDIYTLRYCF